MKAATSVSEWLPWLGRVRFLAITFLLGIVVAARQLTPASISVRSFVPLVALWYMLAIVYVILQRWTPQARVHAPLQIICDLLIITGVVYTTGSQDSYFISMYLLAVSYTHLLVATSVNLICAQRLVRRICSQCKEPLQILDVYKRQPEAWP